MSSEVLPPGAGHALVECELCLKEIPESAAFTPQGEDYVAHFCGIECYERFRLARKAKEKERSP